MDVTISVNKLRLHSYHGVTPQEQLVGTEFEVSATLVISVSQGALAADSLMHTISYADIVALLRHEMKQRHALIETVADSIRRAMLNTWPQAVGGSVTVAKLRPPIAGADVESASVTLAWP